MCCHVFYQALNCGLTITQFQEVNRFLADGWSTFKMSKTWWHHAFVSILHLFGLCGQALYSLVEFIRFCYISGTRDRRETMEEMRRGRKSCGSSSPEWNYILISLLKCSAFIEVKLFKNTFTLCFNLSTNNYFQFEDFYFKFANECKFFTIQGKGYSLISIHNINWGMKTRIRNMLKCIFVKLG